MQRRARELARLHNMQAGGPASGYGSVRLWGCEPLLIGWQKITVQQARAWLEGRITQEDLPPSV